MISLSDGSIINSATQALLTLSDEISIYSWMYFFGKWQKKKKIEIIIVSDIINRINSQLMD